MLKDISPYLSLSIVLVVSTHYATQPIENLYLNMAAKIIMVAGLYALVCGNYNLPSSGKALNSS